MPSLITWNGHDLPEELRVLPAGQYLLEPLDEIAPLTLDEDTGIQAAIDSLGRGEGISLSEVRRRIEAVPGR